MSTTLSPIPHTHHTMAKPKALHAFNSVVLVLALLATFSLVTTEVVQAMWLLLELACHYNYTHQRQVPMSESIYQRALACFDILAVLAGHRGYRAKTINKNKMTKKDMQEMLSAIIDPLLRGRTDEELTELEMTARSGGEVLIMPLDEIRRLVHMWTQALRGEEVGQGQPDKFGQDYEPGSLEWESETSRVQLWESGDAEVNGNSDEERDVKLGIDPRTKPERVEAWSKTRMDETMSETMATYCSGYAAASTQSTLRRKERTEKVAGRCRGFILFTTDEPIERVEEPTITLTENKTGDMWLCEAPSKDIPSDDLNSPTLEQGPSETGDWSQEGDGVEWDMIPMRVERNDQGITYEQEAATRDAEDVDVSWIVGNTTSIPDPHSLGDVRTTRPNQPTLAAHTSQTGTDLPVDLDDIFGTSAARAVGQGAVSVHHTGGLYLRATPSKRGRGGPDEVIEESSRMSGVLQGNGLVLASPERQPKRRRFGPVLMLEEAEARYNMVSPLACYPENEIGGLQPESPAGSDRQLAMDQCDLAEPQMPPTPLKHRRHEWTEDQWNSYIIGGSNAFESAVELNVEAGLGRTTVLASSGQARSAFEQENGLEHGVEESDNDHLAGLLFPVHSSITMSANNTLISTAHVNSPRYGLYPGLLDPIRLSTSEAGHSSGQAEPSRHSWIEIATTTDPAAVPTPDELVMPATPLKHNRGLNSYELWGAPYVTHFNPSNQAWLPRDLAIAMDTPRLTSHAAHVPLAATTLDLEDTQTPVAPRLAQGCFDDYTWASAHGNSPRTPVRLDTSTLGASQSVVEGAPRNNIDQMCEAGILESTTEDHGLQSGPPTLPFYCIRTPYTSLEYVQDQNCVERVGEESTMQPLCIVTRKPVPRNLSAANYAAEEPSRLMLANEAVEAGMVETSCGGIAGKTIHGVDDVRAYGNLDSTAGKSKRPVRVLRVVNGNPSLSSSSSNSSSSLPPTPCTEDSGYSMSKATLAYCNEMTTYWEQSVRQKWQDGVAQWNEDDELPEPSVRLSGGMVQRIMAVFGWSSH
ncbi:hypothetical protein RhiJN_27444 [Ceratobasidium sp. AG-Ba]|nr:hypothetical protein RhiJN_13379 [Ceratobasidium sp. AG-Ba]QRV99425.1 hypothetical protein RhiJN_27444 [Ceratobasidium sp. AG-Ba]QRW13932.1 hypothetical protein RhiLY_12931 [Ceratobasidium sp. AG-Ba]